MKGSFSMKAKVEEKKLNRYGLKKLLLKRTLGLLSDRDDGQTLTEYALIVLLVSLAVIIALTLLGLEIAGLYDRYLVAVFGS
jgi:Flp pilus assembly pilin Flp